VLVGFPAAREARALVLDANLAANDAEAALAQVCDAFATTLAPLFALVIDRAFGLVQDRTTWSTVKRIPMRPKAARTSRTSVFVTPVAARPSVSFQKPPRSR
jgi:hypothetical protein